jgi:hypothetical protein
MSPTHEVIVYKGPDLTIITAQGNEVSEETGAREVAANWATAELHRPPA